MKSFREEFETLLEAACWIVGLLAMIGAFIAYQVMT